MSDNKQFEFDKKVQKLINEELRHNSEKCVTEAWIHLHTRDASKDPYWGMPKEEQDDIHGNESAG